MYSTLKIKESLHSLDRPWVMGIMNLTPDSFYASSRQASIEHGLQVAEQMIVDGVDIIDMGGQSTRPGSSRISADEELNRVLPILSAVQRTFPECIISIDTYFGAVARAAVAEGAAIINDISAWEMDRDMFKAITELKVPYILMHMQGVPERMQQSPSYKDVIGDQMLFFTEKIRHLRLAGLADIIIDPGFGFGKTLEHNYQILARLSELKVLDLPIMAGLSRKGMIWKLLESDPSQALNGSTAAHMIALSQGAGILRVHDVKEAVEAIKIFSFTETQRCSY